MRIGPLFFATGLWRDQPDARLHWNAGDLIKVLIQPIEPFSSTLTVSGRHCTTDKPLRFWYRGGGSGPPGFGEGTRPSPSLIETVGDEFVEIPSSMFRREPPLQMSGGYMIFPAPGNWRLEVRGGSRRLGTATVLLYAE